MWLALLTPVALAGYPENVPNDWRWNSNAHLAPEERLVHVDRAVPDALSVVYEVVKGGGAIVTGERVLTAPELLVLDLGPGCVRQALMAGWEDAGARAGRAERQAAADRAAAERCPTAPLELAAGSVILTATTPPRTHRYPTRSTHLAYTWAGTLLVDDRDEKEVDFTSDLTIVLWPDPAGGAWVGAWGITGPAHGRPGATGPSKLDGSYEAAVVRDLLLTIRQATR